MRCWPQAPSTWSSTRTLESSGPEPPSRQRWPASITGSCYEILRFQTQEFDMPALLALVPVKDWIYAGIIASLLVAFGWYTLHERAIGEKKIEAADAKVVAAQVVHNEEVENVVKSKLSDALKDY